MITQRWMWPLGLIGGAYLLAPIGVYLSVSKPLLAKCSRGNDVKVCLRKVNVILEREFPNGVVTFYYQPWRMFEDHHTVTLISEMQENP
jgi:hypothetical protein